MSAEFAKLPVALGQARGAYALETANPSRSYGLEEADELRRGAGRRSTAEIFPAFDMERLAATVVLSK